MARLDNSTAYMAGRIEQMQAALLKAAEDASRADLLTAYDKANSDIVDELARLFAKHAKDGKLSLTEMYRYGKWQKLNTQLVDIGKTLGATSELFLQSQLPALYDGAAVGLADALGISFAGVDKARIDAALAYPWSGAEFSERVWSNADSLVSTLRQTLVRGFVRGQSFADMTAAVDKAMGAGRYSASRLVRTEAMAMMNQSALDQYRELGAERVQWLTSWDERTCSVCGGFDGTEYALADAPVLPWHPMCRCTLVPVAASDVATWISRLTKGA